VTPLITIILRKLLKDSGPAWCCRRQAVSDREPADAARRKQGLTGHRNWSRRSRPGAESLADRVTEAMTTNESFFFRDKTPFDHFRTGCCRRC
jgi:chemotaxis protein methyltransferase CheR